MSRTHRAEKRMSELENTSIESSNQKAKRKMTKRNIRMEYPRNVGQLQKV